jgi:hypothetical protein
MDVHYQSYVNKVTKFSLPTNYSQQLKNIQTSPKFCNGKPINFPGFSVITPLGKADVNNIQFYKQLKQCQEKICQKLDSDLFIPIPVSTFHLTIADLIWEQDYQNAISLNPNFDFLLIQEINSIFEEYKSGLTNTNSLELELLGLSIFPRAIAICLVPSEKDYEQIVKLRKYIYQNSHLIELGIEQNYDFIAHITLGYFGQIKPNLNLEQLAHILMSINDEWLAQNPSNFFISQLQLSKFEDMITYNSIPNSQIINY